MNFKVLETKFYEVPLEQEQVFISKLRRALFPYARHKKDWEIVSELFLRLPLGKMEMPFQDVMLKTQHGKINVKKLVHVFRKHPIHFQTDWNPDVVVLNIQYKFIFDGTLEPFRIAYKFYEKIQEAYVKELKPNTRNSYKFEELAQKLEVEPDAEFENSVRQLCEIGVLSCHGCDGDVKKGQIYSGFNNAEDFQEWYSKFLFSFQNILEQNRREYLERIPIVRWFVNSYSGNDYGAMDLLSGGFQPSQKVSKPLQVFVFILFVILLVLAISRGLEMNWTACSIFSAAAVSLLVVMINKML